MFLEFVIGMFFMVVFVVEEEDDEEIRLIFLHIPFLIIYQLSSEYHYFSTTILISYFIQS